MNKPVKSNTFDKAPVSLTALSVLMAVNRQLKSQKRLLDTFDEQERRIYASMLCHVQRAYFNQNHDSPSLWRFFCRLPDKIQHWLCWHLIAPGYDEFITARKVMIKYKIKNAIKQQNVEQVVFLGAGFDPRGFLSANKYPEVEFFEIDRGATRDLKLGALRRLNLVNEEYNYANNDFKYVKLSKNFSLLDTDLSKISIFDALVSASFDRNKRTLLIAEGLSMYLTEHEIKQLLSQIKRCFNAESEMLISFFPPVGTGKFMKKLLASNKEKYVFSLAPKHVISFVQSQGYFLKNHYDLDGWLSWIGCSKLKTIYRDHKHLPEPYYVLSNHGQVFTDISDVPIENISSTISRDAIN